MRKWVLILVLGLLFISTWAASGQNDPQPYLGTLSSVEPITLDNAKRLEPIATIGTGELRPGAAWSPDGAWLAVPSSAGIWLYEAAHWDNHPTLLASPTAGIKTVLYNRDGRLLYAGDQNGVVQIWDTTARVQLLTLQTGFKEVFHLALSPDGSRLAAGSGFGGLILWQGDNHLPADGTFQFQLLFSLENRVGQLHFSADGATLFAGGQSVDYFDTTTGKRLPPPLAIAREKFKSRVAFSADGRLIAGMVDDGLQIWDHSAGELLQTLSIAHLTDYSSDFAFINNGAQILVSIAREGVQLWDVSSGQKLRDLPSDSRYVSDISISPGGDVVLYRTSSGLEIEVRSLKTDGLLMLQKTSLNRLSSSGGLAFSPTNLLIYTNTEYPRGLWLADLDQSHFELLTTNNGSFGIAFSQDGDWMLTGGYTLRLWYLPQRVLDGAYPHERNYGVAFNPDGQTYVSGGSVIRVWDFATRTLKQAVGEAFGDIVNLNFDSTGTRLASVHLADRKRGEKPHWSVMMWDSTTYQPLWTLDNRSDPLAFQPGGQRLLIHECVAPNNNGSCDQKVAHLVDTASGETLYTIPYEINSPVFSADGSLLVGGTSDGGLVLWDANKGTELGRWQADRFEDKLFVAFSPDGRYIVTMSSSPAQVLGSGVGWVWGVPAHMG